MQNLGGRPREELDLKVLEGLGRILATWDEMAAALCVGRTTIARRLKEPMYREAYERGKAIGLISLRRAQFRKALRGNATMQIWLGKQYLGQKQRPDLGSGGVDIDLEEGTITLRGWSPEAQKRYKEMEKEIEGVGVGKMTPEESDEVLGLVSGKHGDDEPSS